MPLVTTVVVPQLHDPVLLAKSLATGDMLCGGRRPSASVSAGAARTTLLPGRTQPQTMREMARRGRCDAAGVGGGEDHRLGAAGGAAAHSRRVAHGCWSAPSDQTGSS